MKTLAAYRSLGAIDIRNVARDPLLRWMVILTPAFGLLVRFAVPSIADAVEGRFRLQLAPYYALIMSLLPLVAGGLIGTVIGFLLLDQRDDETLTALLVTPLSLGDYLRYRMFLLVVLSIVLSSVTMLLAGLTATTSLQLIVTSIVAAPLAPVYALFLATFAANKVQGFALVKAFGIVLVPCVVAYFVATPWQYAFGFVPHYWAMRVFWLFDAGATQAAFLHALIGLAWQAALLALLARRFARVVGR